MVSRHIKVSFGLSILEYWGIQLLNINTIKIGQNMIIIQVIKKILSMLILIINSNSVLWELEVELRFMSGGLV